MFKHSSTVNVKSMKDAHVQILALGLGLPSTECAPASACTDVTTMLRMQLWWAVQGEDD
jgi:hypothetical protein